MNIPKYIAFSISEECVILTYSIEGKEINAFITPFQFCTYLVNLNVIEDREPISPDQVLIYLTSYPKRIIPMTWKSFIKLSRDCKLFTDDLLQDIVQEHVNTEAMIRAFHSIGNHNFSFN